MWILTMVILTASNGTTSFTAPYDSEPMCRVAVKANSDSLSSGRIILATCTHR